MAWGDAGYQVTLFHLFVQEAAEPGREGVLFFFFLCCCSTLVKLVMLPTTHHDSLWPNATSMSRNTRASITFFWSGICVNFWTVQHVQNVVSRMQDPGFYEQRHHGNKARSLLLCIQEISWLQFHVSPWHPFCLLTCEITHMLKCRRLASPPVALAPLSFATLK